MDILNQTLSFQAGEELRHRDWSVPGEKAEERLRDWSVPGEKAEERHRDWSVPGEKAEERKAWGAGAPQTLLKALAEMDLSSVYTTMAASEQGETQTHLHTP